MRKLFLAAVMLFSTLGFSQALTQEGNYTTTVYNDAITQKASFNFKVFTSSMGDIVVDIEGQSPAFKKTVNYGNITTVTWVNSGGVWSESQTFVFTKDVKTGDIYVHWTRVVQNENSEPWNVFCNGVVFKQ